MDVTESSESTGLKRLDESILRLGDIVLTTTTAAISSAIRFATRSDISHAMIYVYKCSVIDATSEGVHARNTQRLFLDEKCAAYVLRLRENISREQVAAVVEYARARIGTQYSSTEAVMTAVGGAPKWSDKQFCSRLVAQAFASAGILLVPDPNFCSPADLQRSELLEPVASATTVVTVEETDWWKTREDVPQLMRDAINFVLDGARARDSNIQNFDDLHDYLVRHPSADDEFCSLLEASGYLTVWLVERDKNAWQYDLELMLAAPAELS